MSEFQCAPAAVTVPPCPSGSAPVVTIDADDQSFERYQNHFDHVATQDILVFLSMALSLFIGFVAGKK